MSFFKGLIPGVILTFVVCMIMGSNGAQGAWLEIHPVTFKGYDWYWSWPLFFLSTGVSWGIFWMME